MDNESAVAQFIRNLSFEIETATQDDPLQLKNRSKSTPLNVKIRLRNKNELPEYGIISVPKAYMGKEKIRLANSDQTVMSFDLFMEPDLQKKPARKHRRKLIEIIRQNTCLGTQENNEDLRYLPSSSYKQSSKEQSVSSNSDYLINQPTALSKRIYLNSPSTVPKNNTFLGKCKPGGCLDPPFGEDKYSYSPTINRILEPNKKQINAAPNIVIQNSSSITSRTVNSDASVKHKTIMNEHKDRNVILKLYEAESIHTSLSTTHSNSIITYPPTLTSSECLIYNDKSMNNNITLEVNKLQNTGNHFNNAYFIPPKKVVKYHEKNKLKIPNISIEKANTLNFDMHNMILDNNSEQRNHKKSIHLGHPTYVDTKLERTNNDDEVKTEAVEINQQDKKNTERELSFKEIQIDEDQKSLPTTLSGYLLSQDARSHVSLSNDIEMDLPLSVHSSNKLKLDLSGINVQQTLKQNSHHNSGTPKNFNSDFNSKILSENDNNISTNIIQENTNILDSKLSNTKAASLIFDENIQAAIKQLSNDQNTTISQNISELTSKSQPAKYITANDLTSTMIFMSKPKVCIDQDVPKVPKTSSRSNESINNREYDTNLTKYVYTENKQNNEKNLLLISEKSEGLTTSTNSNQESHSYKKKIISPRDTTTEAENLSINNKIKTLTKHSLLSVNRRSEDTTHNNSVTKYIFINKTSVSGKIGPGLEESNANHSSSLDHIPDSHIVTHIYDLSINNGKQRFLQDESKVDTLEAVKKENSTNKLFIRSSLVQKSDTGLFQDKSQTINLKDTSDSCVLTDTINQNSGRNTSFSSDKSLNKEFVFPVRYNGKNESDMESQLPSQVPDKNNFQIVNSLSKLSSQLIYRNENVPLPATQPHKVSDNIYNKKSITEGQIKPFEIENLTDLNKEVSEISRIYVDKQLFKTNLTSSNVTDELDIKINKNSDTYASNDTGATDLEVLSTQSQNEYADVHNVKIPEHELKTISYSTLSRSRNVLEINNKEKELSLDFDKELVNKNLALSNIKDELNMKISKNLETYVSTSTGTIDLQVLGAQSQNEFSDEQKMNIPEHELKTISHSTLIRANNVLEVNDKEKELSLDFDKELRNKNLTSTDVKNDLDIKINRNSETYVSNSTEPTNLQVLEAQSQNEYSDMHKIKIPEHELKTISPSTLSRSRNVLEVKDKEKELSSDFDKQLMSKNLTLSDIKDDLNIRIRKSSETYVSNSTEPTNLQVLEAQSQNEYSDMHKIKIPEHELKTISPSTLSRSRNVLEVNDQEKELPSDFDKELMNKNLTLSDIKDELNIRIRKSSETYVSTSTGTTDLQELGTQSQNEFADVHNIKIPEHDLKTISHSTLSRSRNVLEVNDKEKELSSDFDKELMNKNLTLSDIKNDLNIRIRKSSETYVSTSTGTIDLQVLGAQSQNEFSDEQKMNIPEHELKTISHSTLIRANDVLEVNDREKELSLDFDKELRNKNLTSTDVKNDLDIKINRNSETYVSIGTEITDLQDLGTQSQNEYANVHKIQIPEHELKTISHSTLSRSRNVLEVNDKEKEVCSDFDKELMNKNLTLSDIKDDLNINIRKSSETYVPTSTGTTDLQVLGAQSQNEFPDVHKMNIPEHELKTISHTTLIRSRNILEDNDREKEPSSDLDKELIDKNLTLYDIKDKLDMRINKSSETNVSTRTADLQVFDTQSQKKYSDLNTITLPEHDLKTISHSMSTLIRSKNILDKDNDKGKELSVDLAFQVYRNEKNQRYLKSFSSGHEPKRYKQDILFKLKTEIKTSHYKVIVPIDTKNDLTIYIDKVNNSVELPQYTMNKGTQATDQIKSLNNEDLNKMVTESRNGSLLSICENELIPLQMAIKGLKEEIDSLAEQQLIFKSSLIGVKKTKLIRFSNVGRRCGCLKNYY